MASSDLTHAVGDNVKPFWHPNSRILILGSFPSRETRDAVFFYGHPSNRFWKVLSVVFNDDFPSTSEPSAIEIKQKLLQKHRIALWNLIAECDIRNSEDDSIQNERLNDISVIIKKSSVNHIFINGFNNIQYFHRVCRDSRAIPYTVLPSTSSVNQGFNLDQLIEAWKIIGYVCRSETI